MRVVPKLTLAFILCTSAVLSFNGYLRVRREALVYERDRTRDHRLMGTALAEAIAAVWHSDGQARALAVLSDVNPPEARIHVGWLPVEAAGDPGKGPIDRPTLLALPAGVPLTLVSTDPLGAEVRYTFVPLKVDGPRQGALELSESMEAKRQYVQGSITDTVRTTAMLAAAVAALSALLGVWIVGRPMRSLAEKARRTGQGDFSGPLHLRQKDELASLAEEMNTMCDRLVAAQHRVDAETKARIAAIEQLRHADRLMTVGKLASGIAHELGTPLNVISARATMIADGEALGEEAKSYARIVVVAVEKMTGIIRQLLEFARRRGPQTQAQPLEKIVVRTLELLRPLAAKKQVRLSWSGAAVAPVDVDANQFEQVMTNLVVNAVQAMTRAGEVKVEIGEERARPPADVGGAEARYACVRVKDEGAGIAAGDLPHVFEPFFTTKDVGEGTGLGLSVAYGIVRDHRGWIAVASEVGVGSTFSVFLPLAGSTAGAAERGP